MKHPLRFHIFLALYWLVAIACAHYELTNSPNGFPPAPWGMRQ